MAEYGRKISVSNPPSEFLIYGGINTGSIIVSYYQLVCCNPQVRAINGAGPGAWSPPQDVGKLLQEIAECLQQNAKSEKATAFLIWKTLLFSVVALTTISEHLHHRIYFTVANILQSPVPCHVLRFCHTLLFV